MTWFTGVGLLLVVFGFGFSGYLLPWDQKAFWATTVGTRIAEVTPLVGDAILRIMRGGKELTAITLARFFGVHVWFLPATLIILIGIHLYLVIRIGISSVPTREE
jgi:quinol-cytochrome oxidoreductase complex cytochrome b subunit